jgi:Tol biopolymer transport system component
MIASFGKARVRLLLPLSLVLLALYCAVCADTVAQSEFLVVSNADGDHEIYLSSLPGVKVRQLTDNDRDDTQAVWSPDGSKIAFISSRDGNQELYLMGADGSGQARLYQSPGLEAEPRWSPDGTQIAFISESGNTRAIMIIPSSGGEPRQLSRSEFGVGIPAWSPDGMRLAFSEKTPKGSDIAVVDLTDDSYRLVTDEPASLVSDLSWAPDGSALLFTYHPKRKMDIAVLELADNSLRRLQSGPTNDSQPQWSPSGEHVLFLSSRTDSIRNQLFVSDASDTPPAAWTEPGLEVINPSWDHAGIGIAYSQFRERAFVAFYQPEQAAQPIRLLPGGGVQLQPRMRPIPNTRVTAHSSQP